MAGAAAGSGRWEISYYMCQIRWLDEIIGGAISAKETKLHSGVLVQLRLFPKGPYPYKGEL
jgi:hypothetical protein